MKRVFVLLAVLANGPACVQPPAAVSLGTLSNYSQGADGSWQINHCTLPGGTTEGTTLLKCGTPAAELGLWGHRRPDAWCNVYRDVSAPTAVLPFIALCFVRREVMKDTGCMPGDRSPMCEETGTGTFREKLLLTIRLNEIPAVAAVPTDSPPAPASEPAQQ